MSFCNHFSNIKRIPVPSRSLIHLLKIIVIDYYTFAVKEAFYPQKDNNIKIDINYDLVRWNNKKIEQIVCFNVRKLEPDFSKKWLKSINLEHIE